MGYQNGDQFDNPPLILMASSSACRIVANTFLNPYFQVRFSSVVGAIFFNYPVGSVLGNMVAVDSEIVECAGAGSSNSGSGEKKETDAGSSNSGSGEKKETDSNSKKQRCQWFEKIKPQHATKNGGEEDVSTRFKILIVFGAEDSQGGHVGWSTATNEWSMQLKTQFAVHVVPKQGHNVPTNINDNEKALLRLKIIQCFHTTTPDE
jgi:hypothetical protein